jgi:hypothetical protein
MSRLGQFVRGGPGFAATTRRVLDSVARGKEHSVAGRSARGGVRVTEGVDCVDLAEKLGKTLRPDADVVRDLPDIPPKPLTA